MYGPVPTGVASVKVPGFTPFHWAFGTIDCPAISSRLVYWDVGKLSVTVLPDVLTLVRVRPPLLIDALAFTILKVKATSAGVSGVPLFHFTPWRIVKVIVLSPLDHAYDVATHGYWIVGEARSNWISGSEMSPVAPIPGAASGGRHGMKRWAG